MIAKMEPEKHRHQGEALLILVRRSGREGKDVAKDLDIAPESLSRMYKKQSLTKKTIRKAVATFGVEEGYFYEEPNSRSGRDAGDIVGEPTPSYRTEREFQDLEAEIERLRAMLAEAGLIGNKLSEMIGEITKPKN